MSDLAIKSKFHIGQRILSANDLFNDGTFPDAVEEEKLVAEGERGEIVKIGTHVESSTLIYLVEFAGGRVIGCLEDEIVAISAPPGIITSEGLDP